MNVQRSPNIPELGLALFSACPDIEILEICDVKTDTCVFEALRNRVHGAKIFLHPYVLTYQLPIERALRAHLPVAAARPIEASDMVYDEAKGYPLQ